MWNKVGMGRTPEGLAEAIKEIEEVRNDFWKNVKVPGEAEGMNTELEKAFRVADFLN
jgi:succinate dehydrogenase / fumarate reductase flavoprotein subunit